MYRINLARNKGLCEEYNAGRDVTKQSALVDGSRNPLKKVIKETTFKSSLR